MDSCDTRPDFILDELSPLYDPPTQFTKDIAFINMEASAFRDVFTETIHRIFPHRKSVKLCKKEVLIYPLDSVT